MWFNPWRWYLDLHQWTKEIQHMTGCWCAKCARRSAGSHRHRHAHLQAAAAAVQWKDACSSTVRWVLTVFTKRYHSIAALVVHSKWCAAMHVHSISIIVWWCPRQKIRSTKWRCCIVSVFLIAIRHAKIRPHCARDLKSNTRLVWWCDDSI